MVWMGRVIGNAMVWLSPSNKKLIDRGCRLVVHQTGCTYEHACGVLHETSRRSPAAPVAAQKSPPPSPWPSRALPARTLSTRLQGPRHSWTKRTQAQRL
jgi:hypothetical protein